MEENLSGGKGFQQIDAAQQSGFSAAGSADYRCNISLIDCEVNVFKYDAGSESFGEMADLKNMFAHFFSPLVSISLLTSSKGEPESLG